MEDKLRGLLGLARRAGKITFGSDATIREIQNGKAGVVVFAKDVSERTERMIGAVCDQSKTKVVKIPLDKLELGHAIGRGETAVAAVTDRAFSDRVIEICRDITGGIC